MSIVQRSSVRAGTLFLKAVTAWASGDLAATQILCLQCLEVLRYSPNFPHLAACLYFLAFCAKDNSRTEYADDVIDCLQNKCNNKVLPFNLPWCLLESFNGTSKSFFELVNKNYDNGAISDDGNSPIASFAWNDLNGDGDSEVDVDGECIIAPPAWYHHSCNLLTAENYESLALFCLDMGLRELGVAFAVRAHQESKRRESPDLVSSDCEDSTTSDLTNDHASPSLPTFDSSIQSPPGQLPSLSLPLLRLLNLPVTLWPDEKDVIMEDSDAVFSVRTSNASQNQMSKSQKQQGFALNSNSMSFDSVAAVRRRARGSILKPPSPFFYNSASTNDLGRLSHLPNGRSGVSDVTLLGGFDSPIELDGPRSEKKRVRFSLSSSHPPPHLEAQFGGRSNSQRLQDMARRRNCQFHLRRVFSDDDDDGNGDDSVGAFDRLVGIFWPNADSSHGRRFRWCFWSEQKDVANQSNFRHVGKLIFDALAFVACLIALVAFSLLFLSLVVCIPLTWFTVDGNAGVTAGTCIRLLNVFGLQALLAR